MTSRFVSFSLVVIAIAGINSQYPNYKANVVYIPGVAGSNPNSILLTQLQRVSVQGSDPTPIQMSPISSMAANSAGIGIQIIPGSAAISPNNLDGNARLAQSSTSVPTLFIAATSSTPIQKTGMIAPATSAPTLVLIPLSAEASIRSEAPESQSTPASSSGPSVPVVIGVQSAMAESPTPGPIGPASTDAILTRSSATPGPPGTAQDLSTPSSPAPSVAPASGADGAAPDPSTPPSPPIPGPAPRVVPAPGPAVPTLPAIPAPLFPQPIGITRFELFSQRFNNFGPFAPVLDCDGVPVAPLTATFLPPILPLKPLLLY